LKNILLAADLTEGIDFVQQASTSGGQGDRLRPDFLLKLPNCGQSLAIDSKAPLYDCYLRADAATSEDERKRLHQEFTRNLRNRVLELSSKNYDKYVSNAVPFIVMFLPSEAALRAAFDADRELFQWAKDRRVMIASPVTIVPLILLIAHAWQQFKVSTATTEIAKIVEQLGTRLETFVGRLSGVQKGLETAAKAWNEAIEKSWFGQQSVVKSFEKVRELGGRIGTIPDLASVNAQLALPITDEG
jgi:DNA recombination protein RmuC